MITGSRGFTLIEVMLALSLSLLLLGAVMAMLVGSQHSSSALAARARAHENLQLAFALIGAAVRRGGSFGCAHPQRPLVRFLNGDWSEIPEYDITQAVVGYDAQSNGSLTPEPALTLPLSGANGNHRVHHSGHGIDLDDVESTADILVVRGLGSPALLADSALGRNPISTLDRSIDFATNDVVLISDCEQAAMVKVTGVAKSARGLLLSWAQGPGVFDNARVGVVAGGDLVSDTLALLSRGFGADATVAVVVSSIFYLAPSLVRSRQGAQATALWLKSGAAPSVEMIAGVDDFQIWYLVAEGSSADGRMGFFQAGQLPADGMLLGLRVHLRSSSVDELADAQNQAVSVAASRTFMLPQFARWGVAL